MLGQDGLRVELDTDDRILAVPQRHDLALLAPRHCLQAIREAVLAHDQRVIARDPERVRQAREQATLVVAHERGLPVHGSARTVDAATVGSADALVAEADAQYRHAGAEPLDDSVANAGLVRRAGAGGDDDVGGCQRLDRGEVERVVAHHEALVAELADVAGEVPDEAVVVVDQEDHQPSLSAATSARAFASVSSYSAAGSLSAVMPPPA